MRISSLNYWVAATVVLFGCAHQRTGVMAWNERTILPKGESIPSLSGRANDPTISQEERARAIFTLLARHVRPGSSGADVRRILTDTRWLQHMELYKIEGLAGWIPVRMKFEESVFCLHLCALPSDKKFKRGTVYFRLSGELRIEDALAFLRGDPTMENVRLTEFALCFPPSPKARYWHGRYETFTTAGMTVIEEQRSQ